MESVQGLTALITGASGGIGSAIAGKFSSLGIRLALLGRSEEKLRNTERTVRQNGVECITLAGDLLDDEYLRRSVEKTAEHFGSVDIVVNNAGMALSCPFEKTATEQFDRIMALNCRAPFVMCQTALPYLRQSQHPTIINIASVNAHKGYVLQSAYSASKHALAGFTKALAAEVYQQGIRVHMISPGGVFTDMVRISRPDLTGQGMILAEDVAEVAAFLLTHRTNAVIDEVQMHRVGKEPFL